MSMFDYDHLVDVAHRLGYLSGGSLDDLIKYSDELRGVWHASLVPLVLWETFPSPSCAAPRDRSTGSVVLVPLNLDSAARRFRRTLAVVAGLTSPDLRLDAVDHRRDGCAVRSDGLHAAIGVIPPALPLRVRL